MGPVWNLEEPVCQTTPYMLKLREPRCKTAVLQQSSSAKCKTNVVQDKPVAGFESSRHSRCLLVWAFERFGRLGVWDFRCNGCGFGIPHEP